MASVESFRCCIRLWLQTERMSPSELGPLRQLSRSLRDTIPACISSSSSVVLQKITKYNRVYSLELADVPLDEQLLGRIEATRVQILILKGSSAQEVVSESVIPRLHCVRELVLRPTSILRGINNPELPWHTLTSLTKLELNKCALAGPSLASLTRLTTLTLRVYSVQQIPSAAHLRSLDIHIISRPPAPLSLIADSLTRLTRLEHLGLSHWSESHLLPSNLAPLLAD